MTNTHAGHRFIESRRLFKKALIATTLLSVISPTYAQDAGTDEEEKELLEVIEVRGIRSSLAKNLDIKRSSNSFVDAITAEDIGKFPDKNVADSLQRVPGVTITRNGGEGSRVSIRGFGPGLTLTQLNGNYIASTPGTPTRSFDFTLLPANMIQRVEVIKSPEARYDEGGVGGTVRAYSHKPFDLDTNTALVQLEATYADVTEDYDPNYSALYSWKNDDENLGFLVGYTNQTRRNRTLSGEAQTWWWWRDSDASNPIDVNGNEIAQAVPERLGSSLADGTRYGEGFWGPQLVRGAILDEDREREGVQATVQFGPTDNFNIGANYFGYTLGLDSVFNTMEIPDWSYGFNNFVGLVESIDFEGDPNQPGAIMRGVGVQEDADGNGILGNTIHPWMRGTFRRQENTSDSYDIFGEYATETVRVSFRGGNTKAEGGPAESFDFQYYGSNWPQQDPMLIENASDFSNFSINGETLNIGVAPDFFDNISSGFGVARGFASSSYQVTNQEEDFAQVDVDLDVDWGIVTKFRVGAKYRDSKVTREFFNTFYLVPGSDGTDIANQDYAFRGEVPTLTDVLMDAPIDNIAGGFTTNQFVAVDINKYRDIVLSNYEPLSRPDELFTYNVGEETLAYYLQADFETDEFRGNLGVRVVETEQYGESTDLFITLLDHTDDATGQIIEFIEGVGFTAENRLVRQDKTNTDVLPSFNIAWEPIDDLVIRGAIAEVISPAPLTAIGDQERLTLVTQEYFDDRQGFGSRLGWSGGGGNKNLEPYSALQFDLGVEWYFGEASILGAGYFQKDIDNFIVSTIIPTTRDINGQQVPVDPYSTQANGSDVSVRGVEVFGNYVFDNGFGFTANLTLLDSEKSDITFDGIDLGESPLPGTSDESFNISVFYERDKYSARASYNYRSEVVLGLQNGLTAFLDEYDQIDLNASYAVSDNIALNFAIVNLTESEQYSYLGEDTKSRFLSNSYSGRRMYAGVNVRF